MATVLKTKFQLRRGNAEVWARNNPVLERGEPGFEIDTGRLKIGNGQTAWNDLEYLAPQSGAGGGVQPDWNQNDNTQPDYVKNRPFYTGDPVETVFVEESTVSFTEYGGRYIAEFSSTFSATVGETYKVYWDGAVYECTCVSFSDVPAIGNLSIMGTGSDTGEPFLMIVTNGVQISIVAADASTSHTFSISGTFIEIKKIDTKYIPWNDAIVLSPPVFIDKSISELTDEEKQEYYNLFNKGSLVLSRSDDGDQWCVVLYMYYSNTIGLNMALIDSGHLKIYSGGSWEDSDITQSGIKNTINNLLDARTVWRLLSKNVDSVSAGEAFSVYINWNDSTGKASIQKTLKSQYVGSSYIENNDILCSGDKEIVLSSSTTNSTKKFAITVDDTGAPTITDESDSSNVWKPASLPTVTESDAGKFLRVSSTGEWVAETILSASEVSF